MQKNIRFVMVTVLSLAGFLNAADDNAAVVTGFKGYKKRFHHAYQASDVKALEALGHEVSAAWRLMDRNDTQEPAMQKLWSVHIPRAKYKIELASSNKRKREDLSEQPSRARRRLFPQTQEENKTDLKGENVSGVDGNPE